MKDNLGEECVKGGLLSFQDKIETTASDFPGKMTVFPVLTLLFHLSLPKIWLFHPNKIIFLKSAIIGLFTGKVS